MPLSQFDSPLELSIRIFDQCFFVSPKRRAVVPGFIVQTTRSRGDGPTRRFTPVVETIRKLMSLPGCEHGFDRTGTSATDACLLITTPANNIIAETAVN